MVSPGHFLNIMMVKDSGNPHNKKDRWSLKSEGYDSMTFLSVFFVGYVAKKYEQQGYISDVDMSNPPYVDNLLSVDLVTLGDIPRRSMGLVCCAYIYSPSTTQM